MDDGRRRALEFGVCWFILTTMAVIAGWFGLVYLWFYADYTDVAPRMQWFHALPTVLGTLGVVATAGASMKGAEPGESTLFSDDYEMHRQVFRMLRLIALVAAVCCQWGLAFLFAVKDWLVVDEYRIAAGIVLVQVPYALALLLRWRQLVYEYHQWAARRREEEGLGAL